MLPGISQRCFSEGRRARPSKPRHSTGFRANCEMTMDPHFLTADSSPEKYAFVTVWYISHVFLPFRMGMALGCPMYSTVSHGVLCQCSHLVKHCIDCMYVTGLLAQCLGLLLLSTQCLLVGLKTRLWQ